VPIVSVPQVDGKWDVSWLGANAGWLQCTTFPTWKGNSVLTAHVSDGEPGPFVHLDWLKWGDQISIRSFGERFEYEVRETKEVTPGDTSWVKNLEHYSWLTLLTCKGYNAASGTYQYRFVVRAVLDEIN
jgi:LPXTG-site transpeptidase (sortase) family protein